MEKEYWEDGEAWIGDQLETVSYPEGKPSTLQLNEKEGKRHD